MPVVTLQLAQATLEALGRQARLGGKFGCRYQVCAKKRLVVVIAVRVVGFGG
jgi:hypothetical protein